jgi:hypothetical protein
MDDRLNSMPCTYVYHIDRLEFLENDKEAVLLFEPMPLEPLPCRDLSAMKETYATFNCTMILFCKSIVVVIMDAYAYNKFCKS